jgi:predicted enzyme related to lactoylglutathione lyase
VEKDTEWFGPSTAPFMINYRVDDLGEMIERLRAGGVEVIQGPESHENGRFAWIMDPDGNKVELWEPMAWDEKKRGA